MQLKPLGERVVLKQQETEMQVKEGDRVIYSQYSGTDVKLEDEEYIIVNQSDIIAIVE